MGLRSLLFIPGHRTRFYEKLADFRPDAVILDLEDAVPPAEKPRARATVREQLGGPNLAGFTVFVRVNGTTTKYFREDVRLVVAAGLDGIFVPKVETLEQLNAVNMALAQAELRVGLEMGKIRVVPILETVRGVLVGDAVVSAPRVLGLAFGAEDFSLDLGVNRSREGIETRFPRARVALVAHAADKLAFDTPWSAIDDPDGLVREAVEARQLGYHGKQAIHPSQVAIINRVFSPTAEDVARAKRIVVAYEEATATGTGAINLDGELIDVPMVERARLVLRRAGEADA